MLWSHVYVTQKKKKLISALNFKLLHVKLGNPCENQKLTALNSFGPSKSTLLARHQAIMRINIGLLSIASLETKFSHTQIRIQKSSFNQFQYAVCKMAAIFPQTQCANASFTIKYIHLVDFFRYISHECTNNHCPNFFNVLQWRQSNMSPHRYCYPGALSFSQVPTTHFEDWAPVDEIKWRLSLKWVTEISLPG